MNRPGRRGVVLAALIATASLVLSACAASGPAGTTDTAPQQDLAREPTAGPDPATYETSGLRLPHQVQGSRFVDPVWGVAPQHRDGVFLAPVENDGHLTFTAVDSSGATMWTAERPLACAGFTLATGPDGAPIAVLNDTTSADGAISQITATAYDLRTGTRVWGPVNVPGPLQGPGLVYAAPPPEAMGDTGPRTALDPATGSVIASEADGSAPIVAERNGTVVLHDDTHLRAIDAAGTVTWETQVPTGIDSLRASPTSTPSDDTVAIGTGTSGSAVIDVANGQVLAASVTSAVLDESTSALVFTDDTRAWAVGATTGDVLWEREAAPESRLTAAGGAQVYLRDGDAIHVLNAVTGKAVPGYESALGGDIVVPVAISSTGAAALDHAGRVFLATTPTVD